MNGEYLDSTGFAPLSAGRSDQTTVKELWEMHKVLLAPLWVKAKESLREDSIINDPKAAEILSTLDYHPSDFRSSWLTQLGVSVRTMLFDNAVRDFTKRHPFPIIVNLGAGLDTRFVRLKKEKIGHWYDLDLPQIIKLRNSFFEEGPNNSFLSGSVLNTNWIDAIEQHSRPVLIIAEGLFMYFQEQEVRTLFIELAERFPGAELLFDVLAPLAVAKNNHLLTEKKKNAVTLQWSLESSRKLETWHSHIRVIREWNDCDYHQKRWKWFGKLGRSLLIRSKISNRVIRVRFNEP